MTTTESKPREWTLVHNKQTCETRAFSGGFHPPIDKILWMSSTKVVEKFSYDKAVKALKKYGRHNRECICHMGHAAYENVCDCGFDEALKELGEL